MKQNRLKIVLSVVLVLAVVIWFAVAAGNTASGQREAGRRQLEDALRRGAAACYAAEGIYPPTVEYLQAHYGIQIDREKFHVFYEVFAENIMPQITVTIAN